MSSVVKEASDYHREQERSGSDPIITSKRKNSQKVLVNTEAVADPGVVPRVPGHHPRLQGWTQFQTTHWLDS